MLCEHKCEFNKHVTPDYRKIYITKFTHQRIIDVVWNTKNLRPLTLRQRRPCSSAIDDGFGLAGQHSRCGHTLTAEF